MTPWLEPRQGYAEAAAEQRLGESHQSILKQLQACGWRGGEIPEETQTLIRTAAHEAVRLNQQFVTTGHLIVAAVRLERPSVGHLQWDGVGVVGLREALHEVLPGELQLLEFPEFSRELTTRLQSMGPVSPDQIVEEVLADPASLANEVLRLHPRPGAP